MSRVSKFQLWNAYFGNLFEHYDTALFGLLSSALAPIIFPGKDPLTALVLTYAIFPLGMLARPIGSIVFGYIGDLYGRERALFITLAGMACVSFCMALIPTYLQVGMLAPCLFFFGRVFQNFFAAGETIGGAIFLLENSPGRYRDLLSGFYSSSTIAGHLLASLGVFFLGYSGMTDPGWRGLYLCGCITAIFGCLMRREKNATCGPANFGKTFTTLRKTIWSQRRALLSIGVVSGFASANYCITVILLNGFVPLVSEVSKVQIMGVNTYLLLIDFLALPFFGYLSSKVSREKVMILSAFGILFFAIPCVMMLEGGTLFSVIVVRTILVLFGVAFFAPFHAWAQQMIPPNCRYAVISLGYAIGYQVLGSPSASLSLWLYKKTGMVSSVVWYWMVLALASVTILVKEMKERSKDAPLEA